MPPAPSPSLMTTSYDHESSKEFVFDPSSNNNNTTMSSTCSLQTEVEQLLRLVSELQQKLVEKDKRIASLEEQLLNNTPSLNNNGGLLCDQATTEQLPARKNIITRQATPGVHDMHVMATRGSLELRAPAEAVIAEEEEEHPEDVPRKSINRQATPVVQDMLMMATRGSAGLRAAEAIVEEDEDDEEEHQQPEAPRKSINRQATPVVQDMLTMATRGSAGLRAAEAITEEDEDAEEEQPEAPRKSINRQATPVVQDMLTMATRGSAGLRATAAAEVIAEEDEDEESAASSEDASPKKQFVRKSVTRQATPAIGALRSMAARGSLGFNTTNAVAMEEVVEEESSTGAVEEAARPALPLRRSRRSHAEIEEDDEHKKIEIAFSRSSPPPAVSEITLDRSLLPVPKRCSPPATVSEITLDRSLLPNVVQDNSDVQSTTSSQLRREVQGMTPPTRPSFIPNNKNSKPSSNPNNTKAALYRHASTGEPQAATLPSYEELRKSQLQETIVEAEDEESTVASSPLQPTYRYSVDSQQLEIQARAIVCEIPVAAAPTVDTTQERSVGTKPASRRFTEYTVESVKSKSSPATPSFQKRPGSTRTEFALGSVGGSSRRTCDDEGCDAPRTPPRSSNTEFTFAPLKNDVPLAPNLDTSSSSRTRGASPESRNSPRSSPSSPHSEPLQQQRRRRPPGGWSNDIVFDPGDLDRSSFSQQGSEIAHLPREIELDSD